MGENKLVLIADDDPLQRKMIGALLRSHGYRTIAAADGIEALRLARAKKPAIILSDVLMPEMDGMQLCLSVRCSAQLADVPVVLMSSYSTEQMDQRIAYRMGASRFVSRSSGGAELVAAVAAALENPKPEGWSSSDPAAADHLRWLALQLERQMAVNGALTQRCALQGAALSALGAVSECLADGMDPDAAMGLVLTRGLEAAGISRGALFWRDDDGTLLLRNVVGPLAARAAVAIPELMHDRVEDLIAAGEPAVLPGLDDDENAAQSVLDLLGTASALLLPVRSKSSRAGLLVLASSARDLTGQEWIAFGKTLATQIGQATQLACTVSRLRAGEMLLQSIIDNAGPVIHAKDLDGRFLLANERFRKLFPVDGDVVGKTDFDCFPRDVAERFRATDREVAQRGDPVTTEERVPHPGGARTYVTVRFPLRDPAGALYGVAGISTDITDCKNAEEQLRQAARMEAVGQLAGGVAHDFNNILSVILGHAELVADDVAKVSTQARESFAVVERAARRGAGLTRQLLAFSRRQVRQPRVIRLGAVVKDIMKMVRRLIGEDIEIEVEEADDDGHVRADPGQIEQVVMNLAVNARDAMPRGGRLTIATRVVTVAADGGDRLPPGRWSVLEVADTGSGMDAATMARIYEPFFTTKSRDRGTGLGLATVYGIVKQSDGHILVQSEPGRGARFSIHLPAVDQPLDMPELVGRRAKRKGDETILVVEDEEDLRTLAQLVLQRHGYKVLVADSGTYATTLTEGYPQKIDLLLTDVVLPGASGPETARALVARRPEMRVLYMSGYTDDAILRHGLERGDSHLLAKPFSPEALVDRVRLVLDAPRAG